MEPAAIQTTYAISLEEAALGPHLRPTTSAPFHLGPVVLAVEIPATGEIQGSLKVTQYFAAAIVKGDVAYARTHSAGTSTVVRTGATGPELDRELFVFARGPDGWKIARYMFNKTS
jgi:hypothetical protein